MVSASKNSSAAVPRILLVEDDGAVRRALQLLLRAEGYDVRAYPSAVGLSHDPEALRSDCLVADLIMPGKDALELLTAMRAAGWQGQAILISGFLNSDHERKAREAGYTTILPKPIGDAVLTKAVADLLAGKLPAPSSATTAH
jgi:two-component system, LuxR family, response regulator FixJ